MEPPQAPAAAVAQSNQRPLRNLADFLGGIVCMAIFSYFAVEMFDLKKVNLLAEGEHLDLWVYVSEKSEFTFGEADGALVWHETNIPYAVCTPDSVRHKSFTYYPSEAVQQNGTLYAHAFFARSGYSPDPASRQYRRRATFHRRHALVVFFPKSEVNSRKSLLSKDEKENPTEPLSDATVEEVEDGSTEWVSFFKTNVTINFVEDFTKCPFPPMCGWPTRSADHVISDEMSIEFRGECYPTVFFNKFWSLRDNCIRLDETVKELKVNMELGPIGFRVWLVCRHMQIMDISDERFEVYKKYCSRVEGQAEDLS